MYALIFWTKSKTTSVINENDLCPIKDEGQETFARYEANKRLYKVKIIRKSEDSEYLRRIRVTNTGEICTKDNAMSQRTNAAKKDLKNREKAVFKHKCYAADSAQHQLADEKSLFSDEEDEVMPPPKKTRKLFDTDNGSDVEDTQDPITPEKRNTSISTYQEIVNAQILCDKASTSRANTDGRDPSCNINERAGTSRSNEYIENAQNTANKELLEELQKSLKKIQDMMPLDSNRQHRQIAPTHSPTHQQENHLVRAAAVNENADDENDSPLVKCRSPGKGRVLLCENYNVWIDPGHLMYIQRWKSDSKEMTRQLLKHLVGKDNLKNMCARGKSNKRPAIPKDIVSCVEYYVNRKCTSSLTVSQFTDVINYLCGTLRNPKLPRPI